jgi:uncharacterized protein YabE (DUF348 family)
MTNKDRLLLLISSIAAIGLLAGYLLTGTAISVSVDGILTTVRTHRATVGGVLAEMGIAPAHNDLVAPLPASPAQQGMLITIERARRVTIQVDGSIIVIETHTTTPAGILQEAGVSLHPRDLVVVDNQVTDLTLPSQPRPAALSGVSPAALTRIGSERYNQAASPALPAMAQRPTPMTISIRRAVPASIIQDGTAVPIMSSAQVVGEALFGEGIYVYAADLLSPALDTPLSAGMSISIRRARPVMITADGRTFATRTQAETVAALLADEGITPQGKDYSIPGFQAAITSGLAVALTRVREEIITEAEGIAYKTIWQPDNSLELDQQRVVIPGKEGVYKRTIRIVYENGNEVYRVLEREWVDEEPATKTIAYGTRVVVRTKDTPNGTISYWRELRVWATYYTAATSGKSLNHPQYGITRTGLWATKGIIAVDPLAIRLHTAMYVPGYGFGAAEDTGGLILGMHIDLCFDDNDPAPQHQGWVSVYLLTPVPADIPYILPDYPRERR